MNTQPPRGMALIELVVASGVLMALMALAAGIYSVSYRGSRGAERHTWALTEAANSLERFSALDWNKLTPEQAAAEKLSPTAQDVLGPAARLAVRVEEVPTEPDARKVVAEVHWTNDGRPAPVVRLTTWRYRLPEPKSSGAKP